MASYFGVWEFVMGLEKDKSNKPDQSDKSENREKLDILDFALNMQCPELHMIADEKTGLKAIVAIHSVVLGPALGGCRLVEYPSTTAAVIDAVRLAQGMTYKAAISNLPLGGGKMVVLKPEKIKDRSAFFKAIGRFVDLLNGRYITAVDSGTTVQDMDIIETETHHVTSSSKSKFSNPDPSGMTALGVMRGIEAGVQYKLGKNNLEGLHITIQGVGHAGYVLAKLLHQAKAKLTIYDINQAAMQRCAEEFGAKTASNEDELIATPSDVFAPCALGGIINDRTIAMLKTKIIAGCANNQLALPRHGAILREKDILYAPDYLINAGGLIYVAAEFSHITEALAKEKIEGIYDTTMEIFQRAEREQKPTSEIVDAIALERLAKAEMEAKQGKITEVAE